MAYQVTLTRVGGERMRGAEIYPGPTPEIGEVIAVFIQDRATNARVTAIRKHRAKAPATENVDDVDAQEY